MICVYYGVERGRFCLGRPGGVFYSFSPPCPHPGPSHTHSLDWPLFFPTKNLQWPVRGMAGVGPLLGVGAGKEEKHTSFQANEWAEAGNFARGRVLYGTGGPVTNTKFDKDRGLKAPECM